MASSQGKNELKFADWMATLPESIHSIPLTNLAIPGRRAEALPRCHYTCPALLYLPPGAKLHGALGRETHPQSGVSGQESVH